MRESRFSRLYTRLAQTIPETRLMTDGLRTLAFGTDASFYRLIPRIVVRIESEAEVVALLSAARDLEVPITFRAAGTSLSGQAITDSVLALLGNTWTGYTISDGGRQIHLQPGIIGAHANTYLAPYGRKIGPDPASINSAMIGGIAANNASGMCCGTAQNSYKTLAGMRLIFADGALLDTRDPSSREQFLAQKPAMVDAVAGLAASVRGNAPLAERIRRKFSMKNTTGYSLNALVDFTDPIDIIEHLMIGSEGTLGFIAEVSYHTVPDHPFKASALLIFPDIGTACSAVTALHTHPVDAVELMDRASLRSVEEKDGMPVYLKGLGPEVAALLVETRAESRDGLAANIEGMRAAIADYSQVITPHFTDVPSEFAKLWDIRKGLFPSVGAMRATGTTCIIEDVAFPQARLAEATMDLKRLLIRHGYSGAIIFGHAREGNLHFVFNQDFNVPSEVSRYERFIDDVTNLVVKKYDGSLKAEHGTGRNMAPFVEREWGAEAYGLMKEIKRIFDPEGLLNPGVVLNDDARIHLKNLKPLPAADPLVDKCIECGFCEIHCPSRDLTLSPRQRITVFREMSRLRQQRTDPERAREFRRIFSYEGDATCATDGLCSLACPVGIDTGRLIKQLRHASQSPAAHAVATFIAYHMAGVTAAMRWGLEGVHLLRLIIGERGMEGGARIGRALTRGALPLWNRYVPRASPRLPAPRHNANTTLPAVVYFPTCINRTLGKSIDYGNEPATIATTISLLEKGGFRVVIPDNVDSLCCGMAFDSKGFKDEGMMKARELERALLTATRNGEDPVYVDMSPCLFRMKEVLDARLRLFEPVEFIRDHLARRLEFHRQNETVTIHTTCSATKLSLGPALKEIAAMCAERVVVPEGVGCCGWAGDRGFTFPELTESALRQLKGGIPSDCRAGYSTSRTCEIGLSLHSGLGYRSIVHLVDRCTTPGSSQV